MSFHEHHGVRYFQFEQFSNSIRQAVFTRRGGVSPAPWDSLNVGGSVGDDSSRVAENRIRCFQLMDLDPASMHDLWLVHGTQVVFAEAPREMAGKPPQADILFTNNPRVTLFMRFADCVPLLFHDPRKKVIGIAHAGWQGTVRGAAAMAIQAMQDRYACKPADICVGIGPSIGPDHYEVGPEVVDQFQKQFGVETDSLVQYRNGSAYLDLWTANCIQLHQAGVEQVETCRICTACHLEDWYSHRAERGKTGRFGALISLQV